MTTRFRVMTGALATACALVLAGAAGSAAPNDERRLPEPRRGDIVVRGSWVIDVRNADGSLAERREFENALTVDGAALLANVLGGGGSVATLMVELGGSSGNNPCFNNGRIPCLIVPPSLANSGFLSGAQATLSIASQIVGDPRLVLSGSAQTVDGNISVVQTKAIAACLPTQVPCRYPSGGFQIPIVTFTEAVLATPIAVVSGQAVSVSVTLSFTS